MTLLVLGFGAFESVVENPSAKIARALDGRRLHDGRVRVVGCEMPVSYERSFELTQALARELNPWLVLGIGVAASRSEVMVETTARNHASDARCDVDGVLLRDHGEGPTTLVAPFAKHLAALLEVSSSEDAGDYVCNSWLYRALRAGLPAAFIHVPMHGLDPELLAHSLGRAASHPEIQRARPRQT